MGKGKGSLSRYCTRTYQNHNLFEFTGFNLREVFTLKKIFQKKVTIPIKIHSDFFLNKQYYYSPTNENLFFFKNYKS